MYIVRVGNTKIYDPRIEELALIDPVVELEENCAGSFSFTIPPIHPQYDLIQKRKSVIQVYQDDELIFSGMAIETEVDFFKQKKVVCEGELAYLNDSIQRPARYQNMTVRGLLQAYINNHNAQVEKEKQFTVGMVTVTDSNNSIYCYSNMESTMQCLKEDLCDDLGGYFRIRHANGVKYIDYLADSMNTCRQVIRLGENLVDFKSNIDSTDIATAIIPLGATAETSPVEGLEVRLDIKSVNNGLDYVCSQTAIQNFGWIYKTVVWDDVTVPANLKTKGQKYLSDIQFENMVIEAKAVDLHFVDASEERFRVSDQIRVVSKPHGLNRNFRLTKQTINLNNPENDIITLGKEERLSLSAKTNQVNESIYKAMESITPASSILKQAKDNATALINGNGENGYVVLHENESGVVYEILIMDTPDIKTATKIWRWNQNGFGYSKDGGTNYELAMTMDGAIVADFITSGSMSADRLSSGTIDASQISVTNLNASNITSGTISADKLSGGSIDASQISVTNLNASNITSGTISADKLSGGTIDASKVTVNNLNASNISSGTMSCDRLNGGTINGQSVVGGDITSGDRTSDAGSVYIKDGQLHVRNGTNGFAKFEQAYRNSSDNAYKGEYCTIGGSRWYFHYVGDDGEFHDESFNTRDLIKKILHS